MMREPKFPAWFPEMHVNCDALRLFLAIVEKAINDERWFQSKDFKKWLDLIGWPETDYRVKLLQQMVREKRNRRDDAGGGAR
jgi:hypothetical protein